MSSKIKGNFWLQDMGRREWAVGLAKALLIYCTVLYLFYESVVPGIVLFPFFVLYIREWLEDTAMKKEQEFRVQFCDSIQALSSSLKTGYSIENAIRETRKDLSSVYGEDARIIKEYDQMIAKMNMNITAVQAMEEFADRVRQEDTDNFVTVFVSSKSSGGDSVEMIRRAVRMIREKMETEHEIQTILAAKKLEFRIMCAVPLGIILYMKLTFGDFLDVLYGNAAGITVMSVCLLVYGAAYCYGRKILRIEV